MYQNCRFWDFRPLNSLKLISRKILNAEKCCNFNTVHWVQNFFQKFLILDTVYLNPTFRSFQLWTEYCPIKPGFYEAGTLDHLFHYTAAFWILAITTGCFIKNWSFFEMTKITIFHLSVSNLAISKIKVSKLSIFNKFWYFKCWKSKIDILEFFGNFNNLNK